MTFHLGLLGTKLFICLKDFQTLYTSDVYDLFPDPPHSWIKCLAVATKWRANTDCVRAVCCLMFSETNLTLTIQVFWDVTL